MRLPPDQGLPRLNGGHVTELERRCRYELSEASGSERLAGMPPRQLFATDHGEQRVLGFISEWPEEVW